MNIKMPEWLWVLVYIDLAVLAALIGEMVGCWVRPEWLEHLTPLVPTLTLLAWSVWAHMPGGMWDQYEAGKKEKQQKKL